MLPLIKLEYTFLRHTGFDPASRIHLQECRLWIAQQARNDGNRTRTFPMTIWVSGFLEDPFYEILYFSYYFYAIALILSQWIVAFSIFSVLKKIT